MSPIGTSLSLYEYRQRKTFMQLNSVNTVTTLKKTWKLLRTLIGSTDNDDCNIKSLRTNGTSTTDPMKIATKLNNYFTGIAHSLAKNIPASHSTIWSSLWVPS